MSQKCEYFSYEFSFLRIWGDLGGPKWSPPPHPIPIPGVNVKVPFRGKNIEKNTLLLIFYHFYEKKIEKCNKTIKSCSIRLVRVARFGPRLGHPGT